MKTYYGNYLGMVIDNNDPEHRGRTQIFVPHIMPTLYEDWNQAQKTKTIKCIGDNIPQGLDQSIVERLKKILPWAEAASPIMAQSGSGNVTAPPSNNDCIPINGGQTDGGSASDSSSGDKASTTGDKKTDTKTDSGSKSNKPIFVSGLTSETNGGNFVPYQKQVDQFKESVGSDVTAFRFDSNFSNVIQAAKQSDGPIVLHSAGGKTSNISALMNAGIDPKRIVIAENYMAKGGDPAVMNKFFAQGGRAIVGNTSGRGQYSGMPAPGSQVIKATGTHDNSYQQAGKLLASEGKNKAGGSNNNSATANTNNAPGSGQDCTPTGGGGGASGNFDQSPTAAPNGAITPGSGNKFEGPYPASVYFSNIPSRKGISGCANTFIQRLNNFYREAKSLGYKFGVFSAFRTYAHQAECKRRSPGMAATPGSSPHEHGIAVDTNCSGPGVSVGYGAHASAPAGSVKSDAKNYDTTAYRALLQKHGLHIPMHASWCAAPKEGWHIEPVESPRCGMGARGGSVYERVWRQLTAAGGSASTGTERTATSQFPAANNPLSNKSSVSKDKPPAEPTTNKVPSSPSPTAAKVQKNTTNTTGTPSGGDKAVTNSTAAANNSRSGTPATGTPSGSKSTQNSRSTGTGSWTGNLAADRTARFKNEITDELLDRVEYLFFNQEYKGTDALIGSAFLETGVNRAFFTNKPLLQTLCTKGYYVDLKTQKSDPTKAEKIAHEKLPHKPHTIEAVNRVIFKGQNITNLATDNACNLPGNTLATNRLKRGCPGTWLDLTKKKPITDVAGIKQCVEGTDSTKEFLYRNLGMPHANAADAYAKQFNVKPDVSPSIPQGPLPPELQSVRKSNLTGEPTGNEPEVTNVNNTDSHGPTVVKNTNDSPRGMFTYPAIGAMVWIFFREGNPQFPVYFAASYSAGEWAAAYSGGSLNPQGTNTGNAGPLTSNSTRWSPNAGGGFEFSHVKDSTDSSGSSDKAVAMMYGDDGSNMLFARGYHQFYTRHDRRDQTDGNEFKILGGAEEKWVEGDSSKNVRGNMFVKIGKIDNEAVEAAKELNDFSQQMNDILHTNA